MLLDQKPSLFIAAGLLSAVLVCALAPAAPGLFFIAALCTAAALSGMTVGFGVCRLLHSEDCPALEKTASPSKTASSPASLHHAPSPDRPAGRYTARVQDQRTRTSEAGSPER